MARSLAADRRAIGSVRSRSPDSLAALRYFFTITCFAKPAIRAASESGWSAIIR